ncbi:HYM1 [Candida margitis]|uniref:HYM1 n=1 Tax=Candida margitis TaxID=1775924 RepID=UPI002226C973|nr:HYM1 [Candida margitis]KAI5954070.1 HYM1 [Candida margitis]
MAFLFKRDPKNPHELVRALNEQLIKLDYTNDPSSYKKHQDESGRYLKQIRAIIYGDDENEPQQDQIQILLTEILQSNNLYLSTFNLSKLDFDSRKDVVVMYSSLLRRNSLNGIKQSSTTSLSPPPVVDYLVSVQPKILDYLLRSPEHPDIALVAGQILRDCLKFEKINKYILYSPNFWNLFKYVENPTFEIACDAMMTMNDVLTVHKKLVSEFLANNYESFMTRMNGLIKSNNYVTKRQSVKLLNDLVSQKANLQFLHKYFADTKNLKYTMLLLSEKSKNLQLEGFHLLKFFVANPKRTSKVNETLIKNKSNFLEFFKTFDIASFHDSSLLEERNYIIKQIEELPDKNALN